MFDAIILTAGKGSRSGLKYNKVLYRIDGKPIFKYSLEVFLSCFDCRKVVLVINKNEQEEVKAAIEDLDTSRIDITYGGELRQDSVANGIEKCSSKIVLIHDGARPLIERKHIIDVYEGALMYSSAVLAVKTTDTIKEYKNGVLKTLNRDNLWNIQTPQAVELKKFKVALKKAKSDNFIATDDVGLLEKYFDITPRIIPGSYRNIKLTTTEDLEYIKYLLRGKFYGI
ncbi:MAG: 2-C-methyl-D-erythritol 4-phosphate cytidylyltransferase [Bacilli bacterium]